MITNYDELKAAVTNWLKRDNLADEVPNFVQLAEATFNRQVRAVEMEARSRAYANGEYLDLPDDYLALREAHIEGSPDKPIKYISPQDMIQTMAHNYGGSLPFCFTMVDGQFQFYPAPEVNSSLLIEIIYLQKIPALSDSNQTNWLLTNHPDLYLYCTLAQAEGFLVNDNRIALWASRCGSIIEEINENANKQRVGTTPMMPRVRGVV